MSLKFNQDIIIIDSTFWFMTTYGRITCCTNHFWSVRLKMPDNGGFLIASPYVNTWLWSGTRTHTRNPQIV